MRYRRLVAAAILVGFNISCASNTPAATPAPSPGGGVAAAPGARPTPAPPPGQTAPPQAGPPGAGGPPGGGRGPQQTPEQVAARRDTLNTMRAGVVASLMSRVAGADTKRAGDQFINVLLMKDSTVTNFLKQMDYYGRSLSVGCQFCHAAGGQWADDSKQEKKTARVMIELVNLINTQGLSKLGGPRPSRISCVTCHRGRSRPGQTLLPQ